MRWRTFLVAGLLSLTQPALGAEMRAMAPVVDVVPIGEAGATSQDCQPARPSGLDLGALLAWDLRLDCPAAARRQASYRVFYRWDGRTYSQVMDRHPGASVPVHVRLD